MTDEIIRATLTTNLVAALDDRGMSIRELARQTGDPPMTVHKAVCGPNLPKLGLAQRIAVALDLSLDKLVTPQRRRRKRA
jgi:transcriptional regulator with XRE-family HTH domain